jgi:GntR family transcriptional regulator/MocR family aminotransferase
MEEIVESRPASGIYVTERSPSKPALPSAAPDRQDRAMRTLMPMPLRYGHAQSALHRSPNRLLYDFFPGRPSAELFPLKTWRRLLQRNLSHGGGAGLTQYGEPAGLPALRTAIANHLAAARGIVADPSRIVIVSGIQEGLTLAARLYLARGVLAVIEDPCYQGAALAFEAAGAELASVAVDRAGLIPDQLPRRAASLLYTTPSHQYPTGATLSAERRLEVIDWARRYGCYIVEDDYDCDIRYQGAHLAPLAALAPDCTIYIGTFSKSLGAGLRLGYMIVPEQIAEAVRIEKSLLNSGNPWLEQATLADFMHSGSYATHLLRVRAHYKENRDHLVNALRRNFGDVVIDGDAGGLHILWQLPPGIPDAVTVEAVARRARVGVYSLSSARVLFRKRTALTSRAIILGYAALSPKQIEKGIARLSDAVDDAIDDPATDMTALFSDQFAPPPAPNPTGPNLAPRYRQQPALRRSPPRRAISGKLIARQGATQMPLLTHIYRYPIKGFSAQPLSRVELEAKKPFPHDRIFALVRPGAPFDTDNPKWGKKGLFVMLMLEEALARVKTVLDVTTSKLTITQGNRELIAADLDDAEDRAKIEELVWQLVPSLRSAPTLVRSPDGHFMDKPDSVISLINLATVRSLEAQWGIEIDPLRFRANFYIDGASPWEEFDWVGSDISIGGALFRVDRRNGRCGATNVDPETGRRDLDIPSSLRASFGHKELGIYLIAREGGTVSVGDSVLTPTPLQQNGPGRLPIAIRQPSRQTFICGGCYFIYEPSAGLPEQSIPPGTSFADIPANWRCPDCGTDKTTFRPHVQTPQSHSAIG